MEILKITTVFHDVSKRTMNITGGKTLFHPVLYDVI